MTEEKKEPEKPSPRALVTDEERLKVCQAVAEFRTNSSVIKAILDRHNISIDNGDIRRLSKKEPWKTAIQTFRQAYVESVAEIPIANRRWRMEKLQELFEIVKERKFVDLPLQKKVDTLLKILQQAHMETDGSKKGSLVEQFNQQFNVVFTTPGDGLGLAKIRAARDTETVPQQQPKVPDAPGGSEGR